MTEHTTRRYNDGEVLSGVQRRRRWTLEEKVRIVEETHLPLTSVSAWTLVVHPPREPPIAWAERPPFAPNAAR